MRTGFLILTFLLFAFSVQAQNSIPGKAKKIYLAAQQEYENFEKQHGNFIQTKNVRLHYLIWGKSTGTPLIWLHGSLLNGYEIRPFADQFVKAGYYVIAVDYYGHGQTAIPDHEVSLYHVADDIKFLMDKLKIKKAIIGGFSRGGYISTAFYDAYPTKVLGLILADGGSVSFNTNYHLLNEKELKVKLKAIDMETQSPWDSTFVTRSAAFIANYDSTDTNNQFKLLDMIKKNKVGRWRIYDGLAELFNMRNSNEFSDLILRPTKAPLFAESMVMMEPKIIFRNLNVPVLILDPVSKNDPFPFENENEALQKQHPTWIKYILYPNTVHNVLYEQPKKFTQDIIEFLQKVKAH